MSSYPYCVCERYCPDEYSLVGDYRLCKYCAEEWPERFKEGLRRATLDTNHTCDMEVSRDYELEPCGKIVVGVAVFAFDGALWVEPVCGHHMTLARKANHVPLYDVISTVCWEVQQWPPLTP